MPTIPELLDQILAVRVQERHRPCFSCSGRGVVTVSSEPAAVLIGDGELTFRYRSMTCPECEGKKRIEGKPDDLYVLAAVYGEVIGFLVVLREQDRFADANAVLDWVADYQKALRAAVAREHPDEFKRVLAANMDMADRIAAGKSLIELDPEDKRPNSSALTDDDLRALGVLTQEETDPCSADELGELGALEDEP